MLGGKPYKSETGNDDEHTIVKAMIDDLTSEHWTFCHSYVTERVHKTAKGIQPSDQDEIIQETMKKAMLKLCTFRFESTLSSWLNSIIQRGIINKYRKDKIEYKYLAPMPRPDNEKDGDNLAYHNQSIEERFEEKEQIQAYVDALLEYTRKRKSDRNKLILKLFIENELNQAEIAKRAGCSATTVKNVTDAAKRYALEKLKRDGWDNLSH